MEIDAQWADRTLEKVKALIVEVDRLEVYVHDLEDEIEDLKDTIYKLRGSPPTPPGRCGLCLEVMPKGEEMFNYHGFSGPCPTKEKP